MASRDSDRQLLSVMAAHGMDLSKTAHVIHYLYFKSIANANSAADDLRAAGFENLQVRKSPPASLWQRIFGSKSFTCVAETRTVLTEPTVFATTDRMTLIATKYGGEYDGWEAGFPPNA